MHKKTDVIEKLILLDFKTFPNTNICTFMNKPIYSNKSTTNKKTQLHYPRYSERERERERERDEYLFYNMIFK